MPIFLLIAALFIPVNLWAAITPHLQSDLSMRMLHGSSLLLLLCLTALTGLQWQLAEARWYLVETAGMEEL